MKHQEIKDVLLKIGYAVCDKVYTSLKAQNLHDLQQVAHESEEDTIYAIDKEVESIIIPLLSAEAEALGGIVLIAEGIGTKGHTVLPTGLREENAAIRIIMDPIDGTRGIMYNKRSAFFLAGAAPNQGEATSLKDIEVAVMTELPTSKAYLSDSLFAIRGQGAFALQRNLLNQEVKEVHFYPSTAKSIIGGFAQIARFFPPGKDLLAKVEEDLIRQIAEVQPGKALLFEDQYISSGGQLYEILMGHDRFVADIRTILYKHLEKEGVVTGLCCHPYDVCAILIGEETGVRITDVHGNPLDAKLNLTDPVDWIAYANEHIKKQVEPVLLDILKKNKWIE